MKDLRDLRALLNVGHGREREREALAEHKDCVGGERPS